MNGVAELLLNLAVQMQLDLEPQWYRFVVIPPPRRVALAAARTIWSARAEGPQNRQSPLHSTFLRHECRAPTASFRLRRGPRELPINLVHLPQWLGPGQVRHDFCAAARESGAFGWVQHRAQTVRE